MRPKRPIPFVSRCSRHMVHFLFYSVRTQGHRRNAHLFLLSFFFLPAFASLPLTSPDRSTARVRRYCRTIFCTDPISCFGFLTSKTTPISTPYPDSFVHKGAFHIPHIVQPRPPRPLLPPLHDLYPLHIRTVNLKPHLHAHSRQLIPQQNPRVDPSPSDIQTHAGERVAVLEPHEQDVPYFGGFGVCAGEEFGAGAGGVEEGELGGGDGGDGVFVGREGAGRGWVGFYFLQG